MNPMLEIEFTEKTVMKTYLNPLAAVLAVALAGPALADSQFVANAGLTPAAAAGLSLTEIAQAKFNRDAGFTQNAQPVSQASTEGRSTLAANSRLPAGAADGLSLTEIAAVKFTRGSSDNNQIRPADLGASLATRSVGDRAWSQLVSNAGLSADEAAGLSLTDIAAAKFDRDNQ